MITDYHIDMDTAIFAGLFWDAGGIALVIIIALSIYAFFTRGK